MPELRLVVLALQDRLVYAPTFESAVAALFGTAASTLSAAAPPPGPAPSAPSSASAAERRGPPGAPQAQPADVDALIRGAAQDLSDYQRLTAEGKLGEAGAKLTFREFALAKRLDSVKNNVRRIDQSTCGRGLIEIAGR